MRRMLSAALAGTLAVSTSLIGAGSAQAAETTQVYAVHGVPGVTVDVWVDGAPAIPGFSPLTTAGPLDLPSGPHSVAIAPAGEPASAAVATADADLPAGASVSIVAHLASGDAVAITPFTNDVSAVPAGQARLVVRHAANAPAVDIRAGGAVVASNVAPGQQVALVVPAGTVSADVVIAGTDTVVLGPADLTLAEGTATFVHAVGSADAGSLGLVSFTVTGLHSAPGGVPAGSGPAGSPVPIWIVLTAVLLGVTGVAFGSRRLLGARQS